MTVLDAFDRGFRAIGRLLLRAARTAWRMCDQFMAWVFLGWWCTATFGLVHGVWAAVWVGSIAFSIKAWSQNRKAQVVYAEAKRLAEKTVAADNQRLELEVKVGHLEIACAMAERTIVELRDGRTQLGPEAIAAAVGLAAEQLARIVADMRDEEFGGWVLTVANHLLELQQDLEADGTGQVESQARVSDLHRRIMEQISGTLAEATQQLVEATKAAQVAPRAVKVNVRP